MIVFFIAMCQEDLEETSQPFASSTTAITENPIFVRAKHSPVVEHEYQRNDDSVNYQRYGNGRQVGR